MRLLLHYSFLWKNFFKYILRFSILDQINISSESSYPTLVKRKRVDSKIIKWKLNLNTYLSFCFRNPCLLFLGEYFDLGRSQTTSLSYWLLSLPLLFSSTFGLFSRNIERITLNQLRKISAFVLNSIRKYWILRIK